MGPLRGRTLGDLSTIRQYRSSTQIPCGSARLSDAPGMHGATRRVEDNMSTADPILVTGAAGRIGGVGRSVVELLRQQSLRVRALVRTDDDRAAALRATGAVVVVGDLTRPADVARAMEGCHRVFFGMSVSAPYLEATLIAA